ncbi:adenosine deaminase [Cognatishimia sp. SS12]|uniref:adenosine deaminase n=1 Tax=Cognatishimia sp. SS12 TaxID=2979465 RepID=UPI00232D1A3B|nr:adenosine deaminase [Cognatishimia sp. SS12]MDC0736718.1 adenosine deaminase [Cognatishimia sp. SS12]
MTVADLPKVELHLHHEGAAPPDLIRQLAFEKKVDLAGIFRPDGSYGFRDFVHFLSVYEAATSVLKTPEDYGRLTTAVLEQSAANNVIYCETFLSPDFCGGGDVSAWREYLHAIREAAEAAEARYGIILRGIVTCVRHFGPEAAKSSALCAAETAGDWITGFGMGGDEGKGHQGDFAYAFDMAREAGLKLTTHAGEFGGPDSVREAINDLNVVRIGHGVRAIEDAALVRELADRQITLEVCPGSNVVLGLYPNIAAHPIQTLRDAGVKVTVSTDDPPFFGTNMRREYEMLEAAFGWQADDFTQLNTTAAHAAFCDEDTRARVLKTLEST